MHIEPIAIRRAEGHRIRLSAQMDGRELWFDIPETSELPKTFADSFLIMGLAGSMLRNEPLVVAKENVVSETLVGNLQETQKILSCWNPKFRKIPIEARTAEPSASLGRTASMYSGGVDSIHALLKYRPIVDDAVFVNGFDFDVEREEAIQEAIARNQRLVDHLGKQLLVIHSNQMVWGHGTGVARDFWNSGYTAAASLLLRFDQVLMPAGHTYAEMLPSGCNPVLDPLWSNGATRFRHVDAELRRSEKILNIAGTSEVLQDLHVCWTDPVRNCGQCEKCIRTMVTMKLLDRQGPFPRRITTAEISRLDAKGWEGLSYLIDNALLANELGRRDDLRALKRSIRRYDRNAALKHFDRGVLGGLLHRIRRRIHPYDLREGLTDGRPDTSL